MERRVLLAAVLAFLVLYAYNTFIAPPPKRPSGQPTTATQQSASPAAAAAAKPAAPVTPPAPAPPALTSEPNERQITIETATVEAVFTNRGARALHWRLKNYFDDH